MPAAAYLVPDRTTRVSVLAITLLVFAAAVGSVTFLLREGLREQVLQRDALALASVVTLQLENEVEELDRLGIGEVPGQLLYSVLKASKLRDVVALRVFDEQREFAWASPFAWSEDPPPPDLWSRLMAGEAMAKLHRRQSLEWFLGQATPDEAATPAVQVWVPVRRLHATQAEGAAQFWIDGRGVAAEFATLDRRLVSQAALAWLTGSCVIVGAMGWAFRRITVANRELRARTEDLLRANRELVLAAKTSALGAVTAHLIHALKNPIAGLEMYVANKAGGGGAIDGGEEAVAASELTRRLRTMVNDVVAVLRDDHTGVEFELSTAEMIELALTKVRPIAVGKGVQLQTHVSGEGRLVSARRGHLTVLALQNLLQNAIEASRPEGVVTLRGRTTPEERIEFTVSDRGDGLPDHVRSRLFEPCVSTKVGGSGLGLALSQQLARQAGAKIELIGSDSNGTRFLLMLDPER
jgi:signal transduction histidine kinase